MKMLWMSMFKFFWWRFWRCRLVIMRWWYRWWTWWRWWEPKSWMMRGGCDGDDAKEVAVAVVVGSHNTGDVSDRDAVAAAVVEEEEEICLVGDLLHETVCPFHGVVAEVVVVEEVIAHWMLWSTTTLSEAIGSLLKKVRGITDQSSSQ